MTLIKLYIKIKKGSGTWLPFKDFGTWLPFKDFTDSKNCELTIISLKNNKNVEAIKVDTYALVLQSSNELKLNHD